MTISLKEKNQIDLIKFHYLCSNLKHSNKIGLSILAESEICKTLGTSLKKWISIYFPAVSLDFNNLPTHISIILNKNSNNNILAEITSSYYQNKFEINDLKLTEAFLNKPLHDDEDINKFNAKLLFSISICLAKYDLEGALKILILICQNYGLEKLDFDYLTMLGLIKYSSIKKNYSLFIELARVIVENNLIDLYHQIDSIYFILSIDSDKVKQSRIENLKYILNNHSDSEVQGVTSYNLGNIYKNNLKVNLALNYYFRSRKLFPDYLKKDYWWREFGALLFSRKHYKWAESSYRRSIFLMDKNSKPLIRTIINDKKESHLINAFIGDCLFYQAKFTKAKECFQKYIQLNLNHSHEWPLKIIICNNFETLELNNVKINSKRSIFLCEQALKLSNTNEIIETLLKALRSNPLNGLAWFNLGVIFSKSNRLKESLLAFLSTGLIQENDKEAQFNAISVAFTQNEFHILQLLIFHIRERYGVKIINELSVYIMSNRNMPLKMKQGLIGAFTEIIGIKND